MRSYASGDHIKVEFRDDSTGESEWMWVQVESCDDERRLVFGRLDSQPVVQTDLRLGQSLAISYDVIREHRKPQDFARQ